MDNYPLVSVYTCVYNGERTLHRVFESMRGLEYPNIEHIIVNDGSTDRTEELIKEYIDQVSFVVKYHKKENGGKHTALNVAWALAEGMFMIQLDADDRLLPHSVRFLVDTYFQIPQDIRHEYWCVHGRCVTQTGEFVGDKYPDNINDGSWKEAGERATKYRGEKLGLQVREYLHKYKFPEVVGVSYIPEGIVWTQINKLYGTWYTNEIARVYYVEEGGNLTDKKQSRKKYGPTCYMYKWKLMHPEQYKKSKKDIVYYSLCYFLSNAKFRKHNGYYTGVLRHCIVLTVLAPVTFIGALALRILKRIK